MDYIARKNARQYALQALYQWHIAQANTRDIEQQFIQHLENKRVDFDYFKELVGQIPQQCEALDQCFTPYLSRALHDLDPIEHIILRLGSYELLHRLEIPYVVCINEALELVKTYGSEDGFKFINAVLHEVAQAHRKTEIENP
jgi:N utilization substance protein B